MPTTHYVSQKFLKRKGLYDGWRNYCAQVVSYRGTTMENGEGRAVLSMDERNSVPVTKKELKQKKQQSPIGEIAFNAKKAFANVPGVSSLKRKNNEIIWVRIGKTDHPAYELINSTNSSDSGPVLWVEWASNGRKGQIEKNQIVEGGLRERKRNRPKYFS